jgi:uncharacterized protein (DUF2384 family)
MIDNLKINQGQLIPFVNLVNEICEMGFLVEEDLIEDWLTQPREFLDDKSPQDLVNEDNMEKVWDLLRFIEIGEADIWENETSTAN